MAAHREGTVIQSDTFDSTTPYTSTLWGSYITRMKLNPDSGTYPQGCNSATTDQDRWETDGSLLLPSPNRTGNSADARFSEYRGIRTNFDPKANLGGIIGPTASNPVWYGVTARIKAPDTLPTVAGQLVETGVTIVGGNAADDQTALQLSWEYDATSGVEKLVLYRSTFCSTGHRTDRAPLVTMSDLSTTSRNIGAGGYGIMTLEVYANSTTQFQVRVYWDESGVGASTTSSVGPLLTHIESLNLFALEGYCGVFMRQDGPISVGSVTTNPAFANANLTARTGIDWWQVEDLREISADPMFPIPEPAASVSLASVVLAGEANASGSGLSVEPDFALPLSYSIESRDFRTSDGTLISSPATSATRRTWEMHWDGLNETQRNTLDALWHASESGVFTFTWSHPQTSEALVLRPVGELNVIETAKNVYGARAVVQEVL